MKLMQAKVVPSRGEWKSFVHRKDGVVAAMELVWIDRKGGILSRRQQALSRSPSTKELDGGKWRAGRSASPFRSSSRSWPSYTTTAVQ
jgi:hypothetical protein